MTHLTFLSSNAGKAKRKSTFQNVLTCENGTRMAGKRQVNGSLGSRYSLDSILSRFCLASLICAPKVLNHRARVLGRFALPEHLSFSKPKVNWLLHVSLICILMLTLNVTNAWGQSYTLITSNSSLSNGDKVVLATKSGSSIGTSGVTGWNGTKDATVGTSGWVQYVVSSASGSGWKLKDETANKFIKSPSDNGFYYEASGGGTCSVNSNGVLCCNSRYLCQNGTYYRMYGSIGSYTPYYVWKVTTGGYSITYECNGATSGCPSNASGQTALPNPLPTPSKTNYTFGGWYTNEGLTTPATAGATLSGNVTLYAKWTCSAKLTVNLNTPTHGTYVVHQGNNASGPVVSDGDVLDNCSSQSLYIVFSPEDGYGVTGFTVTSNGVQDPATAYITDHVRCDYSAGTKTTDITVTFGKACATPTISFPTAAITKYWGDGKFTFAPTITGNDLEAELTFSSNKESCATVNPNTGEVTIVNATGSGSPVTITATLAAATDGDDCQREVSASYTLTIYNKVTWLIDGEPAPAGSQTTFVNEGGKVAALPTAPDGDAVCSGKTFVGWTTSEYTGDAAPSPLYTSVSDFSSLFINENKTFHAVFAEGSGGGGGGGSGSEELTGSEITTNITNTTCAYGTEKTYSDGEVDYAFSVYTDYVSRPWVQMKKADATSYIEISAPGNISQVDLIITTATNSSGGVTDISKHDKLPAGTTLNLNTAKSTNTTNRVAYVSGDGSSTSLSIVVSSPANSTLYLQPIGGACRIWGMTVHYDAGGGGGSYTDYSTTCGNCLAAPEPVVTARTDNAIISWAAVEGATGYTVTCSGGTVVVSGTTATITGLTSETEYTYSIQSVGPNPPYECFNTKNGSFTTPSATIDIVEWEEDAVVIYVDKEDGVNPLVIIDGEVEHGSISGSIATDLFFSKYFEGAGSMKLVAIFNGTGKEISLANYKIVDRHANVDDEYTGNDIEYPLASLGKISAGQEIIFFTRPQNTDNEKKLYECSNSFLTGKASENSASDNPRWIECDGTTFSTMSFNGNDALLLQKSGTNIDVIGARTGHEGNDKDDPVDNLSNNCRSESSWSGTIQNMDYGKTAGDYPNITLTGSETMLDYGVDLTHETVNVHTARCILFRDKTVTSGEKAVALNETDFVTLSSHTYLGDSYPSEWYGRNVCVTTARCEELGWTYSAGGKTYKDNSAATCGAYQYLGEFDYNSYYTEYENISEDTYLDSYTKDLETGEYTIPIANLSDYSCLSLRFQLQDGGEVIAENAVQVPIIVSGAHNTNDAIFNAIVVDKGTGTVQYDKSIERCQTCNVVVLDDAVLTKASDGATHDVPQVRDLTIYPGGKLVVPNSTNYNVHSLALRRQEDDIPLADIKGTLNIGATNGVSLDLRIDPTNWHYITLPYDCNVNDVTFSDGETAKLGEDWLCAWYDGAYRAANKDGGWTDVTAGSTLSKGLGYIVSIPGAGKVRKELRFPMANGVITAEKSNKTVNYVYAYGGDQSDEDLRPNHKGWNLLGNPYMMYYNTDITTPLKLGTLERDPEDPNLWVLVTTPSSKNVRYLVAPVNNGWSGYSQIPITTHMPPFTSYFVQVGGANPADAQSVSFNVAKSGLSSIVARRDVVEEEEDNHPIWYGLELVAPNNEKDNTTLLISNDFTDDYDMMDDLVKMRGTYYNYSSLTTAPVLASRNAKEELAFNALPDESAAVTGVPLNYYAAQAGTYTFQTDKNFAIDEIQSAMLFDAVNNTWTDMLTGNYSFTTAKGDNTDRFTLFVRVERKSPEVATGTDNMLDGRLSLVTIGRTMILSGLNEQANIYVYDMSGKLITSNQVNGNSVWRTSAPATGVYFVRVNSANGQQTMRAIVK